MIRTKRWIGNGPHLDEILLHNSARPFLREMTCEERQQLRKLWVLLNISRSNMDGQAGGH